MADNNKEEREKLKVNFMVSMEIVDFYQEMADSIGIPRSTCMVMALKTYMDQQIMLKATKELPTIP